MTTYKPPKISRVLLAILLAPMIVFICAVFLLHIGSGVYVYLHADQSLVSRLSFTDMLSVDVFYISLSIDSNALFILMILTAVLLPFFIRKMERGGIRSLRDYLSRGTLYVLHASIGVAVIKMLIYRDIFYTIRFFAWEVGFLGIPALAIVAVAWVILFYKQKCSTLEKSESEHEHQPR